NLQEAFIQDTVASTSGIQEASPSVQRTNAAKATSQPVLSMELATTAPLTQEAAPRPSETGRMMEIEVALPPLSPLADPLGNSDTPKEMVVANVRTRKRSSTSRGRLQRQSIQEAGKGVILGAKRDREETFSEVEETEGQKLEVPVEKKSKGSVVEVGNASLKWHPTHK
ncbi:Unknown protein, partial [Striga hermonthica]